MRWPPMLVWPLVGQANSSLLPFLLSLPVQTPEHRAPRDPIIKRSRRAPGHTLAIGYLRLAIPPRRESGQLLLRRRGNEDSAAYTELAALTTAPNVSLTSGRPCSALGLTAHPSTLEPRPGAAHSRPEVRTARPRAPARCEPRRQPNRARQIGLRSVRDCHEGCKPGRGTTGRYIQCSTDRTGTR